MFCVPKAAVLHGKSVGFASQKSRFRSAKLKLPFFFKIIFTKQGGNKADSVSFNKFLSKRYNSVLSINIRWFNDVQ
ncbi:hypothetical protein CTM55_07970 [Prevotella intermedia]|nr:hypothetical protein CTM55_07970 [Prevotella intermedia]